MISKLHHFLHTSLTFAVCAMANSQPANGSILAFKIPENPSSAPTTIFAFQQKLFFIANDGLRGNELWRFDPKSGEYDIVSDIEPGPAGSDPKYFQPTENYLYFVATTSRFGDEVWRTDGSLSGTFIVKDIGKWQKGCEPSVLRSMRGGIVFAADDTRHGQELWFSDGSGDGTRLVSDIAPGPVGSSLDNLTTGFDGRIFFSAASGSGPTKLWVTDGTPAGTHELVGEYLRGPYGRRSMIFGGGTFTLFSAENKNTGWELWRTDGTNNGTVLVRDIRVGTGSSDPAQCALYKGAVYFQADDGVHGSELWRTDGTTEGTVLVKDINPGSAECDPFKLTVSGNLLYFSADDGQHGRELWVTDGTQNGTQMVKDIWSGTGRAEPYAFTPYHDALIFCADDPIYGEEIWVTDGTESGTRLVKDIRPGTALAEPGQLITLNDVVYFSANDGKHGAELWRSDGTEAGTWLAADIALPEGPVASSEPCRITAANERVYFLARDLEQRFQLWVSDGTAEGTLQAANAPSASSPDQYGSFAPTGERLFFEYCDSAGGVSSLWSTEGTAITTKREVSLGTLERMADFQRLAFCNGVLFFVAEDAEHGEELYRLDLTNNASELVGDIRPGPLGSIPRGLVEANGQLYFTADDGVHGRELWHVSSSLSAAVLAGDLFPGPSSSSPECIVSTGNSLFFVADDGTNGPEVWICSFVTGQPRILRDIYPANSARTSVRPRHLYAHGQKLFFAANDGVHGFELWCSDGTLDGTHLIKDLFVGKPSSDPAEFCTVGNKLYFRAEGAGGGSELWVTDGTESGTLVAIDFEQTPRGSGPSELTVVSDILFLMARFNRSGGITRSEHEIVAVHEDSEKTIAIPEIRPGPIGSTPAELTAAGQKLFFRADDGVHGAELWMIDSKELIPRLVKDILPERAVYGTNRE